MRPLLSITYPQGFQKSKKFGHRTLGSEGKKTENLVRKCDGQTNRHAYGHFDLKKESVQRAYSLKIPHTGDTDSFEVCG